MRLFTGVCAMVFITVCRAGGAADTSGAELYADFCASCHGASGHGAAPDLTRLAKRHGGIFPSETVHRIIDGRATEPAHGSAAMPVWGAEFYGFDGQDATRRRRVAELIDSLVTYLHSVQVDTP